MLTHFVQDDRLEGVLFESDLWHRIVELDYDVDHFLMKRDEGGDETLEEVRIPSIFKE